LVQTDAKLNLGTSGGALLNLKGEMVGLLTSQAQLAGYEQAAGYAIPVDDTFRRVVETLMEGREAEYGFLGVGPDNLTKRELALGLRGMRIGTVRPGTPGDQAGLITGDVVVAVNGEERPPQFDIMTAAGDMHLCDANSATLSALGRSRSPYCYVRSFLSLFGAQMETPGAAFQLIVPVTFAVMLPTAIVLRPEAQLGVLTALLLFVGSGLALREALEGDLTLRPGTLVVASHLGWMLLLLGRVAHAANAVHHSGASQDKSRAARQRSLPRALAHDQRVAHAVGNLS